VNRVSSLLVLALVTALSASAAAHADDGAAGRLVVVGEDGEAATLSAQDLAALPHIDASVAHDGRIEAFSGVLLSDLLKRVNAPLGKDLRGPALSDVVIVTASDGYTVALALSDLEPSIRPTRVILADRSGAGAPLDAKEGPFRLVVDGDLKPARAARGVIRVELRRLAPLKPTSGAAPR
jgi:hypothetical protein